MDLSHASVEFWHAADPPARQVGRDPPGRAGQVMAPEVFSSMMRS
jgi:hypothetical protein